MVVNLCWFGDFKVVFIVNFDVGKMVVDVFIECGC